MARSSLFQVSTHSSCPLCGADLVIRSGKHGAFQGCSAYPTCHYVRPLKGQSDGQVIKVLDGQSCPECQATLVLRQGRFGMFIGCSRYPECQHTQVIDKPDDTTIPCPQCQTGHLMVRRSRYGKQFWSCSHYPECQFTVNNPPHQGVCPYCEYPLIVEKKTAQGIKYFCASKLCGKPLPVEHDCE